ncbi:hypothetical protein [Reinekea thalattae]|uniref:Guanylate cyclase domain-containing protein n=1 Tax=Reinekea thalattae TaxID=2593301 RepID=A0A5C8Z9L1_9GAMM|nr:hypothetical protein [Reinekea thalattae]TXR53969.1 hypothetical protein FME95_05315 [Reinekea thalattae]
MSLSLKTHIVAFIDLLGFSSMVSHDCEKPDGEQKYISKLFDIHTKTKEISASLPGMSLTQFSDSVVLSVPYSADNFSSICKIISDFQYDLLCSGILCRGGISYGKHFSTEDFLFSHGLIDAYNIESKLALNPRVVISKALIELVFGSTGNVNSELILEENDGLFFLGYLNGESAAGNLVVLENVLPEKLSEHPSIRAKQIWLIDYFNNKYPENKIRESHRFSLCRA